MARKIRGRNEGSIYQRKNGTWRAQVVIDDRRISHSAKTKSECQLWLRTTLGQLDQGWDYERGQITLEEYLQEWMDAHKAALRDHTIHRYEQIIRSHIVPNIGKIELMDLHLSRIERLYSKLIEEGIGIRTTREVHAILHKSLKKAERYGYILNNPANGAALPRYTHSEMKVLDENQVSRLLMAARNSVYGQLYHIAVVTGMRQGELFGLKWDDLKWNSGVIYVKRQVQRVPGQAWKFVEPKTKAGRRTITLGEGSLQILREHREKQLNRKLKAGDRWQEFSLIFPSSVGTPLTPSNLHRDFHRVLALAVLSRIRFHDLRHTAASLMLNHGVPVIVVSKILGHAKPSTTMDIYGHLINEMQEEAARIMDELVTPVQVKLTKSLRIDDT